MFSSPYFCASNNDYDDYSKRCVEIRNAMQALIALETELGSLSYFELKMALEHFICAIDYAFSRPNYVMRVHPITKKPILSGYDFIRDIKHDMHEWLVINKERNGSQYKHFYRHIVVPIAESMRYIESPIEAAERSKKMIHSLLNMCNDHNYEYSDKLIAQSKKYFFNVNAKRLKASIAARCIVDKRLRTK